MEGREKKRKKLTGFDAKDRRMENIDDNNITSSHRQQNKTKRHVLVPFIREKTILRGRERDRQIFKKRDR